MKYHILGIIILLCSQVSFAHYPDDYFNNSTLTCETNLGLLKARSSAGQEIKEIVKTLNQKRLNQYMTMAANEGVSLYTIQKREGKKRIKSSGLSTYVMSPNGYCTLKTTPDKTLYKEQKPHNRI